ALVRLVDEALGVLERAVLGMDGGVFRDVVAVVEPRRGIEGQQPDRIDAQIGDVVELGDQAGEVADAVVVGIEERLDVQLIDDGVLVPQRVLGDGQFRFGKRGVHGRAPGGAMRQIANGRSAGSRRTRWTLPCQVKRWPRIRSSTSTAPSSGMFHSHNGTSKAASCTPRGSRLTATSTMSSCAAVALP